MLTSCDAAWWLSSVIDRNQELVKIGVIKATTPAGSGACWLRTTKTQKLCAAVVGSGVPACASPVPCACLPALSLWPASPDIVDGFRSGGCLPWCVPLTCCAHVHARAVRAVCVHEPFLCAGLARTVQCGRGPVYHEHCQGVYQRHSCRELWIR